MKSLFRPLLVYNLIRDKFVIRLLLQWTRMEQNRMARLVHCCYRLKCSSFVVAFLLFRSSGEREILKNSGEMKVKWFNASALPKLVR